MNTTIAPTSPTDAPPVDLYREVHKGLRLALFGVAEHAGSLDTTDSADVDAFRHRFADLDMMLMTHHGHEDGPELAALIATHAGDIAASIDTAHADLERQLGDIRTRIDGITSESAHEVYDSVVAFTAGYLAHMNVEEQQLMPRLQAAASDDELIAITTAIRTSVPPPEMCVFLRSMLPAMNHDERTGTLGGMKMGAPPEIFDMFWGVARESLTPDDLAIVATRIGISNA